ncbi:hypothetical protein [Paenibacillus sp. N3.4]|uniref:hypothetical protein n=1 Tax=Paenibacillus sp. N3.4 TaxID=2603222 RepID=UPI0011CCAEBE|nr:hypothetical protein [Paenibacillus sp. N3.4]TXK70854.1 hypothetical protein FU659_33275 [Paenibacillus sp. N3.4]
MTATMAASTVVAILPADFTKADMSQGGSVTDAVYNQPDVPSTSVTDAVYKPIVLPVPVIAIPSVQALEAVQNAKSAVELKTALTAAGLALNLTSFNALSQEDQVAAAEALLSQSTEGYTDTAAVQQALNKVVAVQRDVAALRNAVAAVNSAGSASQMQSALETPYLGLVMMNYRKLNAEGKLAAAEAVRKAIPTGGFVSRTDIQKAFNTAIASVHS